MCRFYVRNFNIGDRVDNRVVQLNEWMIELKNRFLFMNISNGVKTVVKIYLFIQFLINSFIHSSWNLQVSSWIGIVSTICYKIQKDRTSIIYNPLLFSDITNFLTSQNLLSSDV